MGEWWKEMLVSRKISCLALVGRVSDQIGNGLFCRGDNELH